MASLFSSYKSKTNNQYFTEEELKSFAFAASKI